MPLYEYECAKDGRFERIQKFSDPPLSTCPTCGRPVEKLLSSPAIQFKGTGWYVTDYARKGDSSAKDSNGSKDGTSKASEAKSESTPQTSTSPKGTASGGSPSK